ncbi:MAG: hypothetical protein IPH51_19550 [Rubrivivax sp.]|nr:hypothetical protein [Rubrivivax sp.]
MRKPLKAPEGLTPKAEPTGAAFGLAVYPQDGLDVETLLKLADEDMYRRKAAG